MGEYDFFTLEDDVTRIKGIGAKKQEQLSNAGIFKVQDILEYFPVKYKDRRTVIEAISAGIDKDTLVSGKLIKVTMRSYSGKRPVVECTFRDSSCVFYAVFFNVPYLKNTLTSGAEYVVFGKMRMRNGARVWTNPEISKVDSERDIRGIIPVYKHTAGLTDTNLRKWVALALKADDIDEDWIGQEIVTARKLCGRSFAYKNIHFPESERHYKAARYRLIYEKMLMYQLAVRMSRAAIESEMSDSSVADIPLDEFLKILPFKLTKGQQKCINDIMTDLDSPRPMNRLVQGDVGCGKTVVAEAAIYRCAKAGMQSAMMAPTEILARQHFKRIEADLSPFGIRCALLVSGLKASERRQIIEDTRNGEIKVLIGTHAIIQSDVEFNNLALVITDEQHRFGVAQRKSLVSKGRSVNVCVMSATPIPRTLAATVFGDMDFSIIRTMPSDRKKIITRALDKNGRERAYSEVGKQLEAGNRAYIIAPTIDSEDDEMMSVQKLIEEIQKRYPNQKTALLHGRLSSEDKSAIMNKFARGDIQILVSTIVIEVGIDVPEATIIVIENSERFGLAQLHQLRGRVGRGKDQSYCYIINYSKSETAVARAKALAEISDGFEISEVDYTLRGPGDLAGTMQSGNYNSDILAISRYTDILEAAVEDSDLIMHEKNHCDTDVRYAYERMDHISMTNNSNII